MENDMDHVVIGASFDPEHIPVEGMTPTRATNESSGVDLRADIAESHTLEPGASTLFPTGLSLQLPNHLEGQVRPRSGLAFKHGITVLNSPGTIDSDYRGDIGVILINHSDTPYVVGPTERIAQLVIARVENAYFTYEFNMDETERGDGGFGHTGK